MTKTIKCQQDISEQQEQQPTSLSLQGLPVKGTNATSRAEKDNKVVKHTVKSNKITMLKNDIHHCKTSGIFLRLGSGGLIADNDIHSNCEAGIDIRKGANPLILCNRIHSGLRSGIVVLGNGKGIIRSNQIYGNKEAGIYILYNGNPLVSAIHLKIRDEF
uniref:Uncharacterized protein n=1 Tax=Sphaerodactylus townsendi TaxID=933632 RepID=A0ACB8ET62_9SAUR